MKIRTRFFLFFLLLVGLGFYQFVQFILDDLRPRYLATMEESMAETSTLLSSLISSQMTSDELPVENLDAMIARARHWNIAARIYEIDKNRLSLRVYVTDAAGRVQYDSAEVSAVGEDYSQWNDVYLTLRGEYGARTTRADPDDATTSVLYVAAPIMHRGNIRGVVTVAKPAKSIERIHLTAKERIVRYGLLMAMLVILLGLALSFWITWPIEKLTAYANAIRDGRRPTPPEMGKSELGKLAKSFEAMRDALEGKNYVEQYIETLTHEMKSPLSAIRGAAELLDEDDGTMPEEQRQRFLGNILNESNRIQTLVDRLLELSSLESKKAPELETVQPTELVQDALDSIQPRLERNQVELVREIEPVPKLKAERFLLEQAVANLLQNALDFTPAGHRITVRLRHQNGQLDFEVHNTGSSVPDFACDRLFERFYSLARPDTGRRSSGIGLTLVREITDLHGGSIRIGNVDNGVTATLTLPLH